MEEKIYRMLKWLVIKNLLEENYSRRVAAGKMQNKEMYERLQKERKGILKQLPDIRDIIEEKK